MYFSVLTFGCRVNQADSLALERDLVRAGARPVPPASADVVIVNTCSVTASADQGARQAIRRIAREHPGVRVVVTGCFATRAREAVEGLEGVTVVVANDHKDGLSDQVLRLAPEPAPARDVPGDGPCGAVIEPGIAGRTAWTLRVQTGCGQACAYCIIPSTRGAPRSRPLADVLAEVGSVAVQGFREVAITGVHLGSWGRDLTPRTSLPALLDALASHPADVLFRVSSLEPMDCTPEVRRLLAGSPRMAPHFHLPLQHASDRVLTRMRRPYGLRYYDDLVCELHASLPHAAIGSDILVGFPGERDEDHEQNLAWLERSPLTHLHVFPYSDRPGTVAASLDDKVPAAVIRTRAAQVREVGAILQHRFRQRMHGTTRAALTLEDGSVAVTDNYLKVRIPPGLRRNLRVLVTLASATEPMTGAVVTRERGGTA